MDKDLKAQLEDQLYERMSHENEAYLAELRTKPADEIINSAYQIACRENILYLFEEETQLNVRQLQVLMEMSSPLRELYEDWCGRDSNEMELLRGSIEDSTSGILNHRAEIRYSDPKTPIYEKTFTEAREAEELYEWKADHLQSCHCNRMFAQKAEGAHHSNTFRSFLQEWTEKYGLERCMFVLSCSIAQREGDGRFYPPARKAMTIAREISNRVKYELGITASIGVSDNKVTAKLGSDYKKPDAITRIERDNYVDIVYPLPVEDLLYVGPATSKKLRSVGISTIGRLAETSDDFLQRRLGKMGLILSTFAKGLDVSPVLKTDHISTIKSVGNSATTPRDLYNDEDVQLMLILLSESVCARMRELASKCTVVEVSVRNTDLRSFTRQKKLITPTSSSLEMAQVALELFRVNYSWELPIRSIGVRGSGLIAASECDQLSLFLDDVQRQKRERIDCTVDNIRSRFGYMSIQRAAIFADPQLAGIRPKEHVVHPVGYFGR